MIEWKLVPVEPTPEMMKALNRHVDLIDCYWAMLESAPTEPEHPARVALNNAEAAILALSSAPATDAPPVAWIRMDHLRQAQQAPFLCRVEPTHRPGFDLVPIFLAAPPAASAQKGLTDEKIVKIARANGYRDSDEIMLCAFARALLREAEGK